MCLFAVTCLGGVSLAATAGKSWSLWQDRSRLLSPCKCRLLWASTRRVSRLYGRICGQVADSCAPIGPAVTEASGLFLSCFSQAALHRCRQASKATTHRLLAAMRGLGQFRSTFCRKADVRRNASALQECTPDAQGDRVDVGKGDAIKRQRIAFQIDDKSFSWNVSEDRLDGGGATCGIHLALAKAKVAEYASTCNGFFLVVHSKEE